MASMSSPFAFSHPPTLPLVRHPLSSLLRFKVTREPIPQHNSNVLQIPRRLIVLRLLQRLPSVSSTCWCGPSPNMDSDSEASEKTYLLGISTANWCAALGTLGFLETAYLTYIKLSNSDAFCAVGGGGCGDVLNSEYSYVFGVPLPLIGMISYGLVTFLSLQQSRKDLVFGLGVDVRFLLMGTTTSMATASTYFTYLLSTKLSGASCSYCLISIFLSFSLFFITLKEYALEDIQKVVGLQLAIAAIVVAALGNSYTMVSPSMTSSSDITLEPYETEIIEQSTPWTIALAGHLHSIGAKMYGAFWCSHCVEQKQMFGREAAKLLDYIECFPDGAGKGRKMTMECALSGIEGFPTWIINGKVLSGEQNLQTLADASGFVFEDSYASASKQH